MTNVAILDLETTSLIAEPYHGAGEPWEFGLIRREAHSLGGGHAAYKDTRYLWRVKPDLTRADPQSLAVGRFYERTARMEMLGSSGPGHQQYARNHGRCVVSWPLVLATLAVAFAGWFRWASRGGDR